MTPPQTPGAPQHSPTPWMLKPCESNPNCWCAAIECPPRPNGDDWVAGTGELRKEDAALIVEAVNSYHALRAQAEAAHKLAEVVRVVIGDCVEFCAGDFDPLRFALAVFDEAAAAGTPLRGPQDNAAGAEEGR